MRPIACILLAAFLAALPVLALATVQEVPRIEKPSPWKRQHRTGLVEAEFDKWGQWNNAPKVFRLAVTEPRERIPLATADVGTYRELERLSGWLVRVTLVEAQHGNAIWYLVERIEAVE